MWLIWLFWISRLNWTRQSSQKFIKSPKMSKKMKTLLSFQDTFRIKLLNFCIPVKPLFNWMSFLIQTFIKILTFPNSIDFSSVTWKLMIMKKLTGAKKSRLNSWNYVWWISYLFLGKMTSYYTQRSTINKAISRIGITLIFWLSIKARVLWLIKKFN